MSRLFSFILLSFVLLMPMAYGIEKDADDKILDPKEMQFDEDKDTSMMHEDHSEDKDVAPDHEEEVKD